MQASKNSQKKLKAKNHEKLHKNEESQNLHSFWAIAFKGLWFKSPSRNIKSAKKILVPIWIFCTKKCSGS
jgi:hypothetical protein